MRAGSLLLLLVLMPAGCGSSLPEPPQLLARTNALRVEVRSAGERSRLVAISSTGAELVLDDGLLEETTADIRPFASAGDVQQVEVQTARRRSDEGRVVTTHYLLRSRGAVLELACRWPGNEHVRGSRLRSLLRTVSFRELKAEQIAVEVEQIDYNREHEGQKEILLARYELSERGPCRRSVVSQE